MSVDPSVIAAIEAAIDRDPGNIALRSHLAGLRLRSGDHEGALADARVVLVSAPDDNGALTVARDAARLTGDEAQAEGYGRLLAALQGLEPPAELPPARQRDRDPEHDQPQAIRAHGDAVDDDSHDLDDLDQELAELLERERSGERVTLANVSGMSAVLERLELAFLGPLRNPELAELYGKSLRGGLLLYGPPGCGKTFLAARLPASSARRSSPSA